MAEYGGKTVFNLQTVYGDYTEGNITVTVDKIGLDEGVDYFFV